VLHCGVDRRRCCWACCRPVGAVLEQGKYEERLLMKKDFWLYVVAIVFGVLVWSFVSATSGRREAWDSGLYFSVGMPIVCVISAALGYFEPSRPWRWGVLLSSASCFGCC
jgi:hypothetical protein